MKSVSRVAAITITMNYIVRTNAFTPPQVKSIGPGRSGASDTLTSLDSPYEYKTSKGTSFDGEVVKMAAVRSSPKSKLPNWIPRSIPPSKTRFQSSIAIDFPGRQRRRRIPYFDKAAGTWKMPRSQTATLPTLQPLPTTTTTTTQQQQQEAVKKTACINRVDAALFATYFCNMMVVNLSVVTIPALAAEHFSNPQSIAAFVAGVASMAPLGGGLGKLINGFVCQRLGPNRSSYLYLIGLSLLSLGMSSMKSLAPVGLMLVGYEFLSSIQWTSLSSIIQQHYSHSPELMAKGISILSLSSTCGTLAAKTVGAGMLQASDWRTVTKVGALIALLGSFAMKIGIKKNPASIPLIDQPKQKTNIASRSPIESLKAVLGSKVFWMVGLAHSLGMVAKGTDRFLGSFLQDVSGLPASVCAVLTSSVTIGMLFGLFKGKQFASIESVSKKMKILKSNYLMAVASALGLAGCGVMSSSKLVASTVGGAPLAMAGLVTMLSGMLASSVSFQFYQIPNIVSSTSFQSDDAPVALSLIDAVGFFATAQLFSAFTKVLNKGGWSASWGFFSIVFALGSTLMTNAIKPVLIESNRRRRSVAESVVAEVAPATA